MLNQYQLGEVVKHYRESRELSQEELASACGGNVNRSNVAHLEQGLRIPQPSVLRSICTNLEIPHGIWQHFAEDGYEYISSFEHSLSELVGRAVDLARLNQPAQEVARKSIKGLFHADLTEVQAFDWVNSILVHYDIRPPLSRPFFAKYLGASAFKSPEAFARAVRSYQRDAIRLFNSFAAAYERLNTTRDLDRSLHLLEPKNDAPYRDRTLWTEIDVIPSERLQYLGYIAATQIKKETHERHLVANFLRELAGKVREKERSALDDYTPKRKRTMDSLLRKFNTSLPHGFLSPLFIPDADQLDREAERIAPKNDKDLESIEETQSTGLRNLCKYLAADHLDVYVATSMREQSDFVSVNSFVQQLFQHDEIRALKLRYFNPTQSWIDDRVAKGLVEALMLRRADYTIYMAQKEDSFGKDSEASVALGQGKPVIVYVPKLAISDADIDSEQMSRMTREQLASALAKEGTDEDKEVDETMDSRDMRNRLLEIRLSKLSDLELSKVAAKSWADFGLYAEVTRRIEDETKRAHFRAWLDSTIVSLTAIPTDLRIDLINIVVAMTARFEDRARIFRETHPLALQVILSSGVLNGMLVVRSVDSCAAVLRALLLNDLDLQLEVDEHNYKLIERHSQSTVRVISRHPLISSAFARFYAQSALNPHEDGAKVKLSDLVRSTTK